MGSTLNERAIDGILLISEEFPPNMFGGVASVCYDLAYSLSSKGVATTVVCGRSANNRPSLEEPRDNLRIVRLPFIDFPPRPLWFQLQNIRVFERLLKDQSILHVVHAEAGPIGIYLKRKMSKPLVTSIHGVGLVQSKVFLNSSVNFWTARDVGYYLFEYPLNEWLTRICISNSDHIVACSNTTLGQMKQIYGDKLQGNISVIPNGINFNMIEKIKPDSKVRAEHKLTILYCGRLYCIKGIIQLLRAASNLARRFSDINLEVFGKGPLESKIWKLVLKWGLKDIVHMRGCVSHEELIKEIKMSDIVVLPSLYEGQSVVMLEAMACKKPVVAFDFSFAREVITDMHNGLLARAGDIKDLADKILLLLSDHKLRSELGKNAYNYVRQKHNWDLLVDRYLDVYKGLQN